MRQRSIQHRHHRARGGYTLVEMLVAVALVVLMMSLFAEIFQLATGSISTQRGIAENDQRARALTTLFKADLDKRTLRTVVPYFPSENSSTSRVPFAARQGFLYISENDVGDDADDVLQFTVRSTIRTHNEDETAYFGRAELLTNRGAPGTITDQFYRNPNQPEADDGQISIDSTGSSTAAEITYFVRNGVLYRRVLLLREPLPLAGASAQPQDQAGRDMFGLAGPPSPYRLNYANIPIASNQADFWRHYDFSAYFGGTLAAPLGAQFNGIDALINDGDPTAFVLGKPNFRFGFNRIDGRPREFVVDSSGNPVFIGRFTQEETSHPHFNYPHLPSRDESGGSLIGNGNPMDIANTTLTLNVNGVVNEFSDLTPPNVHGPRRAEDMVLSNVHSFDVKVWDDALGMFVDLGHQEVDTAGNPGDYHMTRRLNPNYGPQGAANNRVFDTWHPGFTFGGNDKPPFAVARPGVDLQPGVAGVDDDGANGVDDPGELGWPTSDDVRLPLRAIQMTIRYYNIKTDQIRQLTLIHSFID